MLLSSRVGRRQRTAPELPVRARQRVSTWTRIRASDPIEPWREPAASAFTLREEEIKHTISAPGVDIYVETLPNTLCGSSERCPLSGTSFSAPQVAAVVASCLASGRCKGGTDEIIQTVRPDAREHYLETDRTFGGTTSLGAKFYGHLVWAGLHKQR
ncbi:S8 family serine peptidase [Streptomyces sp. NPDC058572]|uniref:S8 family serine peptidase n=1 Tax=Streptomyces sp. NPDC058572 TaxID=3346546 RepID=UPI00366229CA